MIGSKFSRNSFNQSEVKPKPIVACLCTFSRALCRLRVLIGLLDCLRAFWLAKVITLVLVLRQSFENRSIYLLMCIDTAVDVRKFAGEFVYQIPLARTPNSSHPTSLVWMKAVKQWTHTSWHKPVNKIQQRNSLQQETILKTEFKPAKPV